MGKLSLDFVKRQPWQVTVTILAVGSVFAALIYTMLVPFLPMYLLNELGVDSNHVKLWSGICFSIAFLISGIMAPIWGAMADKHSLKIMAIRAAILLGISYGLGGFVTDVWQFLFVRAFQGFASGFIPASLAILSCIVPKKKLGLWLGIFQSAMTAGGILGPFIGGSIAELTGMRESFYIGGATMLTVGILYIFFIPEVKKERQEEHKTFEASENAATEPGKEKQATWWLLRDPLVMRMLVTTAVMQMTIYLVQPIMPLYIAQLQGNMDKLVFITGIVFSVVGIAAMISSPMWGALGTRWSYRNTLYLSLATAGIFSVLQAIPDNLTGFTAIRFLGGFCFAGIAPTTVAVLTAGTDPKYRGRLFGLNFSAQQVGNFIGPLAGGAMASFMPLWTVVVLSGVILLVNLAWLALTQKQLQGRSLKFD